MAKLKMLFQSVKPVPVILDSGTNSLGIVRSLGQAELQSILVDCRKGPGFYSKYVCGMLSPDPYREEDDFIAFLLDLGSKLSRKGFIMATSDKYLIAICKNRYQLEKYYYFPMSDWSVIEKCINKSKLYKIAEKEGILYPKTRTINSIKELLFYSKFLEFPFIVKPFVSVNFLEELKSDKVIIVEKKEDIDYWINRITEVGLDNIPILLQESIPGEVENLYTLTSYSNKQGNIIAYSTGYKIRQYPPDTGVITAGKVVHVSQLYQLGKKLIQALGFHGISNIEFKKDTRDGDFKLIEINPRPGKWNYSVFATGINLPYLAYREITGETLGFIGYTKKEIIWLVTEQDLLCYVQINKKKGLNSYAKSFFRWAFSIKGKKVDGVFSINDWKPGLFILSRLIIRFLKNGAKHLILSLKKLIFKKGIK